MAAPTLAARGLRKTYGPRTALDGIDLHLDDPQILGVAGPNGSGKTTLIRSLLGLETPTAGEAAVDGTAARDLDAGTRARIGYMPQASAVYNDLTVRGNVSFFASLYGVDDRAAAVDAALSVVDLGVRADARMGELSGGMVRRTSLACAVVHDPDVIVLDEPTVGLDPALRSTMWEGFRERRDGGSVVIVSTHYLEEVNRCDRVLFLRNGRVLAHEAPATLRERTGSEDMESAFLALLEADGDRRVTDGGRRSRPMAPAGPTADGGPTPTADGEQTPTTDGSRGAWGVAEERPTTDRGRETGR